MLSKKILYAVIFYGISFSASSFAMNFVEGKREKLVAAIKACDIELVRSFVNDPEIEKLIDVDMINLARDKSNAFIGKLLQSNCLKQVLENLKNKKQPIQDSENLDSSKYYNQVDSD